jgi:enoyl-CoA hydratase/carnithine racemase
VIAEVFGLAAAAGCQLVASCDIVVAGENASFSVPGVKHGYTSFVYFCLLNKLYFYQIILYYTSCCCSSIDY